MVVFHTILSPRVLARSPTEFLVSFLFAVVNVSSVQFGLVLGRYRFQAADFWMRSLIPVCSAPRRLWGAVSPSPRI